MADNPLANLDSKKLGEINKQAKVMAANFDSIGKRLSQVAKTASKATGESFKGFTTSSSIVQQLNKNLSQLTKDSLKGLGKREAIEKDLVKLAEENAERTATIRNLQDDVSVKKAVLIDLEKELAKEISQGDAADTKRISILEKQIESKRTEKNSTLDVLQVLQDQAEAASQVESQYENILNTTEEMERVNPFTGISEIVQDIPVIGKLFSGLSDAAQIYNEELVKAGDNLSNLQKKTQALGKATLAVGKDALKAFSAFAVKNAVESFKSFDEATVRLQKSLNVSTEKAAELQQEFIRTAESYQGLVSADLNQALTETNTTLGTTAKLSEDTLVTHATLTKQMGFSSDEAGKLMKFAMATGQDFKTMTEEATGTVKVLNAQNGTAIDYKGILKDINNTSNAVKLSTQAQGRNLADAAYQAKKMGLSLDQMDGIAGNLLSFEESIANELEAELLLGKDLNLEKARQKALDGDLVGMSEEIQKQGITAEKFASMNRIEQESIAKALGMQRGEMADMFVEQQALSQLQVKGAKNLDDAVNIEYDSIVKAKNEAIKAAEESGASQEEIAKKIDDAKLVAQEKLNKLVEDSGKKELVDKRKAQTAQEIAAEAQTKAFDRLNLAFDPENFAGFKEKMAELGGHTKALTIATIALTAVQTAMAAMDMFGGGGKIGDWFKSKFTRNSKLDVDDLDDVGKKLADKLDDSLDDVGKKFADKLDDSLDDVGKNLADKLDDSLDDVGKKFANSMDEAADGISTIANSVDDVAATATKTATKTASTTAKAANVAGDVTKAGAQGGGLLSKMWGGAKDLAGKATSKASSIAGGAMDMASSAVKGVKNVASTAGGAISKTAASVGEMGMGAAMKRVKDVLGSPIVKGFGKALGPIMTAVESIMAVQSVISSTSMAKAAGEDVDYGKVGKSIVQSAAYPIANAALNFIPGVGTALSIADGILGAFGYSPVQWVTDNLIDLLPNSTFKGLGEFAIDKFGGGEEQTTPIPQTEGAGGVDIAPDMAADFISRPGQPIQKFRADDVVIGATNPMGGGSGDNARTVELLERLVAAVEKGGVINMDGNKVGTVLGMSSYRTQ